MNLRMIRSVWESQESLQLQRIWVSIYKCDKRARNLMKRRVLKTRRGMTCLTLETKIIWWYDKIKSQTSNFKEEIAGNVTFKSKSP